MLSRTSALLLPLLCLVAPAASATEPSTFARLSAIPGVGLAGGDLGSLPSSAADAIVVGPAGAALRVRAIDLHEGRAERVGGTIAFTDVSVDTDVLFARTAGGVEEWRLLRSARAPHEFHYRVTGDAPVADVSVREGAIEARTADGALIASAAPLVAFDARGRKLDLDTQIARDRDGWTLDAKLSDRTLQGASYPIAVDPAWTTAFGFPEPHTGVCVKVTPDGRILIIGGDNGAGHNFSSGAIFDPALGYAVSGGPGIAGMGCTQMRDGRVAVVGGGNGFHDSAAFDLFDPSLPTASAWTKPKNIIGYENAGGLAEIDADHLLALSGFSSNGGFTAEIFTFSTTTWATTTGSLNARSAPLMQRLNDGRILVVGGDGTTQAELYTFGSGFSYTSGNTLVARSNGSTITLLNSGKVLLTGEGKTAELFDPATGAFTATGSMLTARSSHIAVKLGDGRVLVAGGSGDRSSEIYDPTAGSWSTAGLTVLARSNAGGALAKDGRVVVAGGTVSGVIDNSAEYWGNLLGVACKADYECVSGHCTDGVCCSVASCGAGLSCGIPPALGTCTKTLGSTCSSDGECATGHCADGVCCATTCTGLCASCALPGKTGSCSAVNGLPLASHGTCSGSGVGTTCGPSCNGSDTTACHLPGASTACGAATCKAGTATSAGACDGAGSCAATSTTCGAFACNVAGTACLTKCTSKADCAAGYACDTGSCVPPADLGKPCTSAASCSTGFCSDGVCCGVAFCGADSSCALGKPAGTCGKKLSVSCKTDNECGPGTDGGRYCVDGVCCNAACTGQCQACDVEGYVGQCTGVNGAPHGSRTACSDGGGSVCAAMSCHGIDDATKCTAFANGPSKSCSTPHCDSTGKFVTESFCDGKGTCAPPTTSSCAPYACVEGKGCPKTCTVDTDCVSGDTCRAGRCEPGGATCTPDGVQSVGKNGTTSDCAPYRCIPDTGACATSCKSSDDCLLGATCDTGSGTCKSSVATTNSGGGCAVPNGGGGATAAWMCGVLAALVIGLRVARRAR